VYSKCIDVAMTPWDMHIYFGRHLLHISARS